MNQMKLKGCHRCGGDLFPDQSDREGRTLVCLQCGSEVSTRTGFASRLVVAHLPAPASASVALGS